MKIGQWSRKGAKVSGSMAALRKGRCVAGMVRAVTRVSGKVWGCRRPKGWKGAAVD